MNHKKLLASCICLLSMVAQAQSWLPTSKAPHRPIRLVQCTYDQAKLRQRSEITPSSTDWEVTTDTQPILGGEGTAYLYTFKAKRDLREAGVAVVFDQYNWTSDNYVLIPAVVYNGNRQRIVNRSYATGLDKSDYNRPDLALTSNPIPQLSPEFGAPSRLEVNISNTSTPAMVYLDRAGRQGTLLLTDQGIDWKGEVKDHALIIEEAPDRSVASFVISAPGVRERKPEFIGFSQSPDRGLSVKAGEEVTIRVTRIAFPCAGVPELLARFHKERKLHTLEAAPRNRMPMSQVHARMVSNIEERYYQGDPAKGEKGEFYCPENANWMSYGWVGGLINTYPMLALNDVEHIRKVSNTFDFALSQGKGASGYYYDVLGADGQVILRDGAKENPGIALTRKNSDILYWMVKQFMLLQKLGRSADISPEWEKHVRALADAFVSTWNKYGTWGNYLQVETGEVAAYNTTSGALTPGGLALASLYFKEPKYREIAQKAAAAYYDQFALLGFTSGGCGDILQNADSETAAALMTSLMTLFETTGMEKYLHQSADLANLCATWTVSFPYRLPMNTALGQSGANLTGAVWASTQNKHGAPGFCTQSGDALFKLYRATGNVLYADLIRDIIHAHAEGIQPNGKISERLTYCDADSRGALGGQTGWNETNGALMAIEIPSIYVRTDQGQVYVFDHVEAQLVTKKGGDQPQLRIINPTAYDATVTVLVEDAGQAARPLGDNAFVGWTNKVTVKAGRTLTIKRFNK